MIRRVFGSKYGKHSCKKIKKIESFSNPGFGNTFPDQPTGHYIGKVFWFYLIRELYLNAGLAR